MNVSSLFLAPGFEEMEAIAVVDILRRGGLDVRTVSVGGGNEVTGAHQILSVRICHWNKFDRKRLNA